MHGRTRDLSMIALGQQRRVIVFLLVLAGSLLSSGLTAEAKSDYEIINTGITGGGCWVDDSHFVIEKRVYRSGSHDAEFDGLYLLDPSQPNTLRPISLAPLEVDAQKRVWQISCQDGYIIFLTPGTKNMSSRLYRLRIGGEPELIVDMGGAQVSLKGGYVLGRTTQPRTEGGPFPGTFDGDTNCLGSYQLPAFNVLCSHGWFGRHWPLEKFILSEYEWRDRIRVRGEDGTRKEIPNPEKPRLNRQGKPKRYELFLRDLTGRILRDLRDDPNYWVIPLEGITTSVDERFLYVVCGKWGQKFDNAPYVCRYPLDGQPHQWEEVVTLPTEAMRQGSIRGISVNRLNNIAFFIAGANYPDNGIWMFKASTKQLIHVTTPEKYVSDGAPKISPDGNAITFDRKGILMLAKKKEARL